MDSAAPRESVVASNPEGSPNVIALRPTRLRLTLLSALLLVPVGLAPRPAAADDEGGPPLSGRWEIRRALRDADDALGSGRFDQAAGLYEQVVASTEQDDSQWADALYGLALAQFLLPWEQRDGARAAAALRELADSFPDHDRRLEVAAVLGCFDEAVRRSAEAEGLTERVAELEAAIAEQSARLAEQDATAEGRAESFEAEAAELREEVARLRGRLATTEAELKKKQEALEKVKATLVGGG